MEALLQGSPAASSYLLPKTTMFVGNPIRFNYNPCFFFTNVYPSSSSSSSRPLFVQTKPTKSVSVIVSAQKKDKKEDSHSFVSKPDEAGFFPEAVLLKKKTVEEDGQVLPEFQDAEERQLFESLMLEMESDTSVELMRHYEMVYLIHEKHEEEVAAVNEKIQDFLREKKGIVWRLKDWGMRKLAYKIKKAKSARYILMNFELDAEYINEFKTLLDRDERVIRHLVIKMNEAVTEDCPPPPEFHTLRANVDDDEEESDEDYDDDDDWDGEQEMDGDDDDGGGGEEIIFIDGDDDDTDRQK